MFDDRRVYSWWNSQSVHRWGRVLFTALVGELLVIAATIAFWA